MGSRGGSRGGSAGRAIDFDANRATADGFVLDVSERLATVLMHIDHPGVGDCHTTVTEDARGLTTAANGNHMSIKPVAVVQSYIYNLSLVFYLACTPLHNRRVHHHRPFTLRSPDPRPQHP